MTQLPCRWCGRPFVMRAGPGRPRRYCRASCRQRDYEARQRAAELGVGEHELVIARSELEELKDRLFVLQCAVDDAVRDLAEAESDEDRRRAYATMLAAALDAVASPEGR